MEKDKNILVAKTAEDFERTYNFCLVNPPEMRGFVNRNLAENTSAGSEFVEKIYNDLES